MIFITAKFAVKAEDAESWPDIADEFTQATRARAGLPLVRVVPERREPERVRAGRGVPGRARPAGSTSTPRTSRRRSPTCRRTSRDAEDRELRGSAGRLVAARRDGGPGLVLSPGRDRAARVRRSRPEAAVTASALAARVRVRRCDTVDCRSAPVRAQRPAPGHGLLLRRGGDPGQAEPAGPAGARRRDRAAWRGRDRQLRGPRLRRAFGDGHGRGAPPLPAGGRPVRPLRRLPRGERGGPGPAARAVAAGGAAEPGRGLRRPRGRRGRGPLGRQASSGSPRSSGPTSRPPPDSPARSAPATRSSSPRSPPTWPSRPVSSIVAAGGRARRCCTRCRPHGCPGWVR